MADIAPLGFAVDTKALADAAAVAQDTAVKIAGVADAADKVGEATEKSAPKVKKSADAHKETAKAVTDHAKALDTLGQKAKDVSTAISTGAESELQARQRIHDMVERSLAQLDVQAQKQRAVLQLTGQMIPKNLPAQQFEKGIEAKAYANMGPTDADIARQAKATKEATAFRKEMQSIAAAVDPAQAKLMKLDAIVENLGKKFDAGRISQADYYGYLNKIDQQEKQIAAGPSGRSHIHNTFLGEAARSLTYGIPRFGREARRLVYSAESEENGGSLGAGLKGFATLGAGAAVGMLGVEAFRYIAALPGKIAEANDQAEKLERRLSSLDIGGLKAAQTTAESLHISVKGAADAMVEFHNAFTRLATDQSSQDKAFSAIFSAGRIGGLDEQARAKSAADVAQLSNKQFASASDIFGLQSSNPVLAKAVAGQFGTDVTGLAGLAATGQVSGERLYNAVKATADRLKSESDRIPQNAKELEQKAKDSSDKLDTVVSDHVVGFFYRLSDKINTGLFHLFGGAADAVPGGSSVRVRLPAATGPVHADQQAVNRALALNEQYGSFDASRRTLRSDLGTVNAGISAGAEGKQLDALKAMRREIEAQLQEPDTPFTRIRDQVEQVTAAFGSGGGNTGLIGVWQQALQIQDEQKKMGHGVAASLQEIVDKLLDLKRAQQAIADTDELKKLQQSIDSTTAKRRAIGLGSYEDSVRSFRVQQDYEDREHNELFGASGSAAGTSSIGGVARSNFSSFLDAIRMQESGNRDFDAHGNPIRSAQGALYGMQMLPSTAARPGFGIAPAASQSAAEYDRVGTALAKALYDHFGGDVAKAAGAYHSGIGGLGHLGPKGQNYVSSILRRLGLAGGSGGAVSAGAIPNVYGEKRLTEETNFFAGLDLQSAQSLSRMVGNPDAFMRGGVISGGTIGAAQGQSAAYRGGADEGQIHRLQLEQQIAEEVKSLDPAYRSAYRSAKLLEDAANERLKAEQDIFKLNEQASDNARRADAARSGNPAQMKALELELQIEKVRHSPLPTDAQDRQIAALNSDARGQSLLSTAQVIGGAPADNEDAARSAQLVRYSTEETADAGEAPRSAKSRSRPITVSA
jgi:hypothetical protein